MPHRMNLLRGLLIAVAALASFWVGSQWLQPSSNAPDPLALAVPLRAPGKLVAPPVPANVTAPALAASEAERDPSLRAPQRLHSVPNTAGNAFAPLSWLPPPKVEPVAPPPPPTPPAAAVAPPLPFTFVGLLEQGLGVTQPKAFLARGDALLVVAAGDTIETHYSVDSITAQQITMTYLPLKTRQTLNVSGAAR